MYLINRVKTCFSETVSFFFFFSFVFRDSPIICSVYLVSSNSQRSTCFWLLNFGIKGVRNHRLAPCMFLNWSRHRFKISFLEFLGSDVLQSYLYSGGLGSPVVGYSCIKRHEYSHQKNRQWQSAFLPNPQFSELLGNYGKSLGILQTRKPESFLVIIWYVCVCTRARWGGMGGA